MKCGNAACGIFRGIASLSSFEGYNGRFIRNCHSTSFLLIRKRSGIDAAFYFFGTTLGVDIGMTIFSQMLRPKITPLKFHSRTKCRKVPIFSRQSKDSCRVAQQFSCALRICFCLRAVLICNHLFQVISNRVSCAICRKLRKCMMLASPCVALYKILATT